MMIGSCAKSCGRTRSERTQSPPKLGYWTWSWEMRSQLSSKVRPSKYRQSEKVRVATGAYSVPGPRRTLILRELIQKPISSGPAVRVGMLVGMIVIITSAGVALGVGLMSAVVGGGRVAEAVGVPVGGLWVGMRAAAVA